MKSELKPYRSMKSAGFRFHHKLAIRIQGLMDGPTHRGGVLPVGAVESGVARIQHWTTERLERLEANWNHYRHSIPAARAQADNELVVARLDLTVREETLVQHMAEYRRTHNGLEPPAPGGRTRSLGIWILGGLFTLGEIPFTGAAFERLLATDWERFIATLGAAAVTIYLAHQIGSWFAKPAKTMGQRIFGWLMALVLFTILATLSIVRSDAVREHLKTPIKATPEVRLNLKGDRSFHV